MGGSIYGGQMMFLCKTYLRRWSLQRESTRRAEPWGWPQRSSWIVRLLCRLGFYPEFGLGGCDCLWLFVSSCLLQGALTWCCWWLWLSFIVYVPPLHKFAAQWCFWLSFQRSPRMVFKVLEVTHCFLMLWFFKCSCSSGRFSMILNIFSLD